MPDQIEINASNSLVPSSSNNLKSDEPEKIDRFSESQPLISESKLDLIEEKEKLRLKLRRKEKKEKLLKQKINKLMFFFFTLQNKGVPVNDIYEQEGIKAIRTDRFDEIMAQIARENGDSPEEDKLDNESQN